MKVAVLLLVMLYMTSCTKDELVIEPGFFPITKNGVVIDCSNVATLSDWEYSIGDGLLLKHTAGLRSMALSGSVQLLNQEFCGAGGSSQRIPGGLDDDPEQDGYATQINIGNYVIAMYHPSTYPDHFITYNYTNGDWVRWELGDYPTKFRFGSNSPISNSD